jgi:hypothetical protein
MRIKHWASWLAVAAILLHATTIARHNVIRFQAVPAGLAPLAGFEAIALCHTGSEVDGDGTAPAVPAKGQDGTSIPCPICLGLASAHALPASDAPSLRVPYTDSVTLPIPQTPRIAPTGGPSLPLARGPPNIA